MINKLSINALLSLIFVLPSFGFKTGDEVVLEALAQAEFIQGEAPEKWQEDELYIFECWATWCGPCIAAIPHMDELYDQYHEKGLNVFGMNVFEDGRAKVSKFVEKKGDGMSYPVAYVGRGGAFEKSWLKAAKVRGIPHAFIVKNGKLILAAHPSLLKEDVIVALLAGGETEKAAIQKLLAVKANKGELAKAVNTFRSATYKKDLEAMKAAYEHIEKLIPKSAKLSTYQMEMKMMAKDWAGLEKIFTGLAPDQTSGMGRNLGFRLDEADGIPDSLRKLIVASLKSSKQKHLFDPAILARQHWALGDKEEARTSVKRLTAPNSGVPENAATDFIKSFETDQPHRLRDFSKAVGAAMK